MWEAETWLLSVHARLPGIMMVLLPDIEQSGRHDGLEVKSWIQNLFGCIDYGWKVFFKFCQSATRAMFFSSVVLIQLVVRRWLRWWCKGYQRALNSTVGSSFLWNTPWILLFTSRECFTWMLAVLSSFSNTSLSLFFNILGVWGT